MRNVPLTIALVYDYVPGGAVTFTRALYALLRGRGHQVTRIALCDKAMAIHADIGIESDHVFHYPEYGNKHRLRREFLAQVGFADVIISSSYLTIVWRVREDSDIPYIHIEHLADPQYYIPFSGQRSCYDYYITVNRDVAMHIADIMRERAAVRHIRNPMVCSPVVMGQQDRSSICQRIQRRNKVVLFVGRVEHGKGADILCEIARQAHGESLSFDFEVVGHVYDPALAEEMGKILSMFVRGNVSSDKMPDVYRSADIFLLLSRSESMSYALLEALMAGCSVVAMNTNSEVADILKIGSERPIGHICADVSEVMDLLRCISDQSPTLEDRKRGIEAVQQYIDNEKTISEYEQIIYEVLDSGKFVQRPSTITYPNRLDYAWMPDCPLQLLRTVIHGTPMIKRLLSKLR